jgi:hypothetical protein
MWAIYKSMATRPTAKRPLKPEPRLLAALAVTTAGDVVAWLELAAGVVGLTKGMVVAVTPNVMGVVGGGAVPVEVVTTGMLITPGVVALYVWLLTTIVVGLGQYVIEVDTVIVVVVMTGVVE